VNKQEVSPNIGPWIAGLFFRGAGGVAAGGWHWMDIPETVKKIPQVCSQAIEMSMQPGFGGGNEFNRLVFECKTNLGAADPWIAGVGGAIAGLVMMADGLTRESAWEDEYSKLSAAWHFIQGACVVATPALVDVLMRRFIVDASLPVNLFSPEMMKMAVLTGVEGAMLAVGAMRLLGSGVNLIRLGAETAHKYQVGRRARRRERRIEELKAQLSQEEETVFPRPSALRGLGRVFQTVRFERVDSDLTPGVAEHIGDLVLAGTQGHFRALERFFAYQRFVRAIREYRLLKG